MVFTGLANVVGSIWNPRWALKSCAVLSYALRTAFGSDTLCSSVMIPNGPCMAVHTLIWWRRSRVSTLIITGFCCWRGHILLVAEVWCVYSDTKYRVRLRMCMTFFLRCRSDNIYEYEYWCRVFAFCPVYSCVLIFFTYFLCVCFLVLDADLYTWYILERTSLDLFLDSMLICWFCVFFFVFTFFLWQTSS